MKVKLTSIFVNDQAKALEFYTRTLGFVKKQDVSAGPYRWLTVVSGEEPNGTQVVLEPNQNPAARTYQESIFKQGIPSTMFFVDDIQKEYQRLNGLGRQVHDGADKDSWVDDCTVRRHRGQPDSDHPARVKRRSSSGSASFLSDSYP